MTLSLPSLLSSFSVQALPSVVRYFKTILVVSVLPAPDSSLMRFFGTGHANLFEQVGLDFGALEDAGADETQSVKLFGTAGQRVVQE